MKKIRKVQILSEVRRKKKIRKKLIKQVKRKSPNNRLIKNIGTEITYTENNQLIQFRSVIQRQSILSIRYKNHMKEEKKRKSFRRQYRN